jgi:hypothetical protein
MLLLSLLLSILLVIMASWNLNTFIRLDNASKDYPNDQAFTDSCHVSKTYTTGGKTIAIVVLVTAIVVMAVTCVILWKKQK